MHEPKERILREPLSQDSAIAARGFKRFVTDSTRSEPHSKGVRLGDVEVPVAANSSSRIIRFSTFEANLHTGELRKRGQKIKLQEQPFQLLAALLEQPGQVVTREDLRSKLWPADTFVDFDHSLNAAIRRLRDALGDSAENPTFVETVARRGYRFLAPVTPVPATGNGAVLPISVRTVESSGRFRRAWLMGPAGL